MHTEYYAMRLVWANTGPSDHKQANGFDKVGKQLGLLGRDGEKEVGGGGMEAGGEGGYIPIATLSPPE